MRIGGIGARPPATDDVASAIIAAMGLLGQRPAITVIGHDGRHEQGFRSLAGWVAKGANLLQHEFGLRSGDLLGLAGPPDWTLATVALSAWWSGITIVPAGTPGAEFNVLHVATAAASQGLLPGDGEVLWIGDAPDGSADPAVPGNESWVDAVTPHPDRPPAATHDGSLVAIRTADGSTSTQRDLLAAFLTDPVTTAGLLRHGSEDLLPRTDGPRLLAALALRPLVTGAATVVIDASDPTRRTVEAAERVVSWIG